MTFRPSATEVTTKHESPANGAMTALAVLVAEGIDPAPYFAMVADNLIARFGAGALDLAIRGGDEMRRRGDEEGFELWQEVEAMIIHRLSEENTGAVIH
jgi:hypothetical protein